MDICSARELSPEIVYFDSQHMVPTRMRSLPVAWVLSAAIQMLVFVIQILCYAILRCRVV
jgi:hypothetical protein